ncbi:MAG: hypothetical protein R2681_09805 [Pyrinomonadaceae bacterium]
MKIRIARQDLIDASASGIIDKEQAELLWNELSENPQNKGSFTGVNVAYYFGSFIIISAMGWFATEAFANFSAAGLMLVSAVYFAGLLFAGMKLFEKPATKTPGGLLITTSVFMVPLFIFSVQHQFGLWGFEEPGGYRNYFEWIRSGWFFMEIGTIITSVVFLFIFRFPFLAFPLAFTLWFAAMDLTPALFGDSVYSSNNRETVSMIFGLTMLIATFFVDKNTKKDYAFWLYLFGLLAFWGGLSLMGSGSEFGKFVYFLINIGLVLISVVLKRTAFLVFGSIGAFGYLGYLSSTVFGESIAFPFALTALGILIIFLGVKYARNQKAIEEFIASRLPRTIVDFLPPDRS